MMLLDRARSRELLALAARAAGLSIDRYSECGLYIYTNTLGKWWSPLMDDGDTQRIAIKLDLCARRFGDLVEVCGAQLERGGSYAILAEVRVTTNGLPMAYRLGYTQAAAELGSRMP